ncbi:hypothetical protein V1272_007381 [Bradyrhizobium sp. AZCC 1708]
MNMTTETTTTSDRAGELAVCGLGNAQDNAKKRVTISAGLVSPSFATRVDAISHGP